MIPAGADLVMQMHYTSTKKSTEDQTKIGLVWAKEPVKERIMTMAVGNDGFEIPPGADNYAVRGMMQFRNDAVLLSFFPHMHLRGKAFEYNLIQETRRKSAEGQQIRLQLAANLQAGVSHGAEAGMKWRQWATLTTRRTIRTIPIRKPPSAGASRAGKR